ncbi:response regulator transcription factor [Pedobacter nutrimenti]|uniref:DNA-binding NarL/FixJ family response regulator n=1 Tax=Pedobacter nutrimenti TaxID=1241337 RepID=A0A318UCH9_9SPHI|nr:response regulator transcription factor [Pedobacter nutrimenti]PYF74084.1 DNA-binding NarL/FixJ family response regulator [Pedobacter nutrimenti]
MQRSIDSEIPIRVVITDDHSLFADGLEQIINQISGFRVVAKVNNGRELLQILNGMQPDLILLDINMPEMDGLESAMMIKRKFNKLKIIFVSTHFEAGYKNFIRENNIEGFIAKNITAVELKEVLKQVMSGIKVLVTPTELQSNIRQAPETDFMKMHKLTKTEIEIIQLIAEGYSTKLIADKRGLSHLTVESHRKNIFRKLHAKNMADVVAFAVVQGIYKK